MKQFRLFLRITLGLAWSLPALAAIDSGAGGPAVVDPHVILEAVGVTDDEKTQQAPPKDPSKEEPKDGISLLPLVAANSTYGLLMGGVFFYNHAAVYYHKIATMVAANTSGRLFGQIDYEASRDMWVYKTRVSASNFLESYYPNQFVYRQDGPYRLVATASQVEQAVAYRLTDWIQAALAGIYKQRHDGGQLYTPQGQREKAHVFPSEETEALEFRLNYDHHWDNAYTPLGTFIEMKLLHMPGQIATTLPNQGPFSQLSLDLRRYVAVHPSLTLAGRAMWGDTQGSPSYLYQYWFGGDQRLRGYGYARFRGSKFYITQWEGRIPITELFSGDVFADVGDITFDSYHPSPLWSYGVGIKLALPPDRVAKMRLEIGFGREAVNVSMQANHAF